MQKTKSRSRHDVDIYDDIAKIKDALFDTATHVSNRATGALSDSFDNAREKTVELQENVEGYVTEKPMKSLAIAMLSGIFLGYLIHGKRNSLK